MHNPTKLGSEPLARGKIGVKWQPTLALLPGKSHGQRNLVGCSPWGRCELVTTEWLRFHFSLSCIGEGNGNSLQCSCLENPRDGGAWWAAVYGVAQSQTQLKQLSSSSIRVWGRLVKETELGTDWKWVGWAVVYIYNSRPSISNARIKYETES